MIARCSLLISFGEKEGLEKISARTDDVNHVMGRVILQRIECRGAVHPKADEAASFNLELGFRRLTR